MGVGFQPVQPSTAILFWRTSPGLFQTRSNECIWWSHWCFSNTKNKQNIDFSLKPLLVSLVLQQNQTRKNKCFTQKTNFLAILLVTFCGMVSSRDPNSKAIYVTSKRPVESWAPPTCGHEKRHTVPRSRIAKHGALGGNKNPRLEQEFVQATFKNFPGWKWMKYD